jgi:protein phosphatase
MIVKSAGKSHIGLKRKINEDNYLIAPDLGLYVIADGMGGHRAGDVASQLAVDTMADYWRKVKNNRPPSFLEPMKGDISEGAKHLINSILFANIFIHKAQKKPQYHRMGTTVSALLVEKDCAWAANVGDSPVYLFERGRLIQISEEHSLEAEQRNMGWTEASDSTDPFLKHLLTRVLGLTERVEVFISPIRPDAGDIILMCSDGLTNYVSEQSIAMALDDLSVPPERRVDILVDEANRGGGGDNISVILLEVMEEGKWVKLKKSLWKKVRVILSTQAYSTIAFLLLGFLQGACLKFIKSNE